MKLHEILAALRGHEKELVILMADVQVNISITVAPAATPLTVDATGVPATATVGVAYSGVIKASGGTPPYTFNDSVPSALPPGLVLNADGTITGTPTTAGAFTDGIDVVDSAGAVAAA